MYSADLNNARIRKVDAAGVITTVAGCDPQNATCAQVGAGDISSALSVVILDQNVALDSAGNILA